MLGFEQANRYVIMDGQGQTLGYIAEEDHGMGTAIKRQMFKTHRSFTTHVFDAREREVLRVHRPFAWINSRIRIYDPVPEGGFEDVEPGTAMQETGKEGVVVQSAAPQVSPLKMEEMRVIGEAQQQWAPLRRKYNLFTFRPLDAESEGTLTLDSGQKLSETNKGPTPTEQDLPDQALESGMKQFAHVNEPFLSYSFNLRDQNAQLIGNVNRDLSLLRDIFTDTGVYALRMDSAAQSSVLESGDGTEVQKYEREARGMSLDQRAVMLATAVSIDFDYFSRHSGQGSGGFMPLWFWGGSGAEAGGAGAAGAGAAGAEGAAGAAGAGVGAAEGAVTAAGRGAAGMGTAAESGIAGAGTMAGYEAMQRGVYGGGSTSAGADDASPQAAAPPNEPFQGANGVESSENRPGDDVWGEDQDPWGGSGGPSAPGGGAGESGGGSGDGEGGGWMDTLSDFFGGD